MCQAIGNNPTKIGLNNTKMKNQNSNSFANSLTSFRKRLTSVNSAFFSGNEFWFDAAQYGHEEDQNFYCNFNWGGQRFLLVELVGYTNGGANWSSVTIRNSSDEVVYTDHCHDGNGAYQTGDGQEARCEYTPLTKYIVKSLSAYAK